MQELLKDLESGRLIPIVPDIFGVNADRKVSLRGSRCRACQWQTFPRVQRCARCHSGDIDDVLLSPYGTVDSFTMVHQGPGEWKGEVPYVLVRVQLQDGVMVVSHLRDCLYSELSIGLPVRTAVVILYEDEGRGVVAPVFVPASRSGKEGD